MATPHGMTELRVDIPTELAQLIDAVMMAKGLRSRAEFCVPELQKVVDKHIEEATVLLRCARINPLATDKTGP